MPELIINGHIYISMPPLYKVIINKKEYYALDDKELKNIIKGKNKYKIQRFKGLGEMDSEQLWETTMNPKTRVLKQITIDDYENAEQTINILMSDKVQPRREFIENN